MKNTTFAILAVAASVSLLIACGGNEKAPAEKPTSTETGTGNAETENTTAATAVSGEEVYKRTCLACHQPNGEGIANTFPPLAKSDFLVHRDQVIEQVIKGKTGEMTVNGVKYNNTMPPQNLSDDEIAAVLTYVYSNWGNQGNPVTAGEVKSVREKL